MSRSYNMRILIEEDHYPDLYAKLSEAKHPRARAEMLRHMASLFLIQQGGTHVPSERGSAAQSQVPAAASEPGQTRTTRTDDPKAIATPSIEKQSEGLRLSANMSNALVAGLGKYLG
jgi:hypothetical protein